MEDKILLRLRYIHLDYLDIVVDDPDRCNILDIFVDLIEGAEKKGMFLPAHPTLWYSHCSQTFQLESDNDIVKMFTVFHGQNLIQLDIGSAESPSRNLELARGLIESKKSVENSLLPMLSHGSQPTSSRRVLVTSARRRGIYAPKSVSTSHSIGSQPIYGDLSRTNIGGQPATMLPDTVLPDAVLFVTVLPDAVLPDSMATSLMVFLSDSAGRLWPLLWCKEK